MNVTKRAASVGLALSLVASLCATIAAPAALAGTIVTSAGAVSPGGTSAGTASFMFSERTASSFPASGGTLTVTITDILGASTVHFTGSPVLTAPGSLGASVAIASGGNSFTVTATASDVANPEIITVSNLSISADAGAAAGAIKATLSGTLAAGVTGGTTTASGTLQGAVLTTPTTLNVSVNSSCGFAITDGGLNSKVNFSDIADPRSITSATALSGAQQTLTIDTGAFVHGTFTTITQTVADCHGTATLDSPGTVGAVAAANHLAFIIQPGGGGAGAIWAQQPAVAVENSVNAVITTDNSTLVTLSIGTNPAGGTLTCTSGTSRVVVNGVATFSGCSINNASVSPYTLVATSSPVVTAATSSAFIIGTTGNHLAFIIQPGGGGAGAIWAQQPSVAVENSVNAIITTDNSTVVTLSIGTNPAAGTLTCTSGTSRIVVNGVATFSGCSINNASVSPYTLVATSSPVVTAATSNGFIISGGLTSVTLVDSIARGVNHGTTGFGTASLVVPANTYVTLLGITSPALFNASVQIWTRTKTGPWVLTTARLVAADGNDPLLRPGQRLEGVPVQVCRQRIVHAGLQPWQDRHEPLEAPLPGSTRSRPVADFDPGGPRSDSSPRLGSGSQNSIARGA